MCSFSIVSIPVILLPNSRLSFFGTHQARGHTRTMSTRVGRMQAGAIPAELLVEDPHGKFACTGQSPQAGVASPLTHDVRQARMFAPPFPSSPQDIRSPRPAMVGQRPHFMPLASRQGREDFSSHTRMHQSDNLPTRPSQRGTVAGGAMGQHQKRGATVPPWHASLPQR